MRGLLVIYLAAIDWSFRRQDHQYIAEGMAARGAHVLFVENTGVRWPGMHDARRVWHRLGRLLSTAQRGAADVIGGITVIPPRVLPVHPSALARAINRRSLTAQIRRVAPHLSPANTLVWTALPNWTSLDLARSIRPSLSVYYCGEEFAAVPGADPSIRESERLLLKDADLVFATSRRLMELCQRAGARTELVPVGVDLAAFAPAARRSLPRPDALAAARGRIIGYMGGLNHKVDVALLDGVARSFPDDTLVILGSVEDPSFALPDRRNVMLIGERPHDEVPRFLQHFDACLIPYVLNDFTTSVYPAKLNEYLAAGRPIVSTRLHEVEPFSDVVRIADDGPSFIDQVGLVLRESPDEHMIARRVAAASLSSYDAIVPRLLEPVERLIQRRRS